eukprot:m51a1_g11224 hypothetical protein (146) ;mRNA; r:14567-15004
MPRPAVVALLLASALACASGLQMVVSLRSAQGRYVTVSPDGSVSADSATAGAREQLAIEGVSAQPLRHTIRTWLGTYAGASREGVVAANATAAGEGERWALDCGRPVRNRCSFQSAYGAYLATKGGRGLRCDSPVPELFDVVYAN